MINTGSYHVYPQEVRDAITTLPYIRAAASAVKWS
jgi:hypothetical protein